MYWVSSKKNNSNIHASGHLIPQLYLSCEIHFFCASSISRFPSFITYPLSPFVELLLLRIYVNVCLRLVAGDCFYRHSPSNTFRHRYFRGSQMTVFLLYLPPIASSHLTPFPPAYTVSSILISRFVHLFFSFFSQKSVLHDLLCPKNVEIPRYQAVVHFKCAQSI